MNNYSIPIIKIDYNKKQFVVFPFDGMERPFLYEATIRSLDHALKRLIQPWDPDIDKKALKWIGLYPLQFQGPFNRCVEEVVGAPWAAAGGWGYYWDNPYGEHECSNGAYAVGQLLKQHGIWLQKPDEFDLKWERDLDMAFPVTRSILYKPVAFVEIIEFDPK